MWISILFRSDCSFEKLSSSCTRLYNLILSNISFDCRNLVSNVCYAYYFFEWPYYILLTFVKNWTRKSHSFHCRNWSIYSRNSKIETFFDSAVLVLVFSQDFRSQRMQIRKIRRQRHFWQKTQHQDSRISRNLEYNILRYNSTHVSKKKYYLSGSVFL